MADTKTQHAKPARVQAGTQPAGRAGNDQVKRVLPAAHPPTNEELLAVDAESLGRTGNWQGRLHTLADWFAGRNGCPHRLEDQADEPCDAPLRVENRAWYRTHRADRALDREHDLCEHPPTSWAFAASVLQSKRPGAKSAWDSCLGCPFSYLGVIEPDASIEAALREYRAPEQEPELRQIPAYKPHLRPAARAQKQGVAINGSTSEPLKCRLWRGKFNSAGFAVVERKDQTCLVIALVLRKKLGRPIKPGHRPRLLCGNRWCFSEDCVVEQYVPGSRPAEIVTARGEGRTGKQAEGLDLERATDEILDIPRSTYHTRRLYFTDAELARLGRLESPASDTLHLHTVPDPEDGPPDPEPHFWIARPDLIRFGPVPPVAEIPLMLVACSRLKRRPR